MSPETSSEATALRNRISTRSGPRSPCIRRRAFRLRYSEVSATDKQALDAYLETLSNIQVQSLTPTEQFSYWINVYNALTVKTVLEHYPVKSIREISLGGSLIPSFITGGTGPWQAKLIQIDGESVALDDIAWDEMPDKMAGQDAEEMANPTDVDFQPGPSTRTFNPAA